MAARFLIRPEAQADIEEAAFWYEDQRPALGELFTRELFELIHRIVAVLHQRRDPAVWNAVSDLAPQPEGVARRLSFLYLALASRCSA